MGHHHPVFMPLMWPALVTTGLLAFIAAWNEFLFALTFTSSNEQRTVPVAIALLSGGSQFEIPRGTIMAASVIVTARSSSSFLSSSDASFPASPPAASKARRKLMTTIQLRNLRKSFGAFDVIKGIDMDIRSGEFMVFVGPSGCGKSTLLRLICGLEEITGGTLSFDGEAVNRLPPAKRGVAMVFSPMRFIRI